MKMIGGMNLITDLTKSNIGINTTYEFKFRVNVTSSTRLDIAFSNSATSGNVGHDSFSPGGFPNQFAHLNSACSTWVGGSETITNNVNYIIRYNIKPSTDEITRYIFLESSGNLIGPGVTWDYSGWCGSTNINGFTIKGVGLLTNFFLDDFMIYNGSTCPYVPINNFTISATSFYFNETIINFNATVGGVFYETSTGLITTGLLNTEASLKDIYVNSLGYDTKTYLNYNISDNLEAKLEFSYYLLNITAKDFISNTDIVNFTINYNGTEYTSNGEFLIINATKNNNAYITIDKLGYALSNTTILINDWIESYQFNLYPTNSISIYIRDEATNNLITENVTILFSSISGDFTNYTSSGTFFIESLDPNSYDITFSSENYQNRIYTVTVSNRSHQNLNSFLSKSTDTTIFSITNKDTTESLQDVSITMDRTINGTWTPVESRSSDITGRVQFTYEKGIQYRFTLTKSNYDNLLFYLNPVLFSTYNIQLQPQFSDNFSQDYIDLSILYSERFIVGSNTFNFLIQSPKGVLINYGYDLTFKNISVSNSGINAIGEQLTNILNISNASASDRVRLDYYYETSVSEGQRGFTAYFPIEIKYYNNTMIENKDKTFGLGLLERILVIIGIGICVLGVSSLSGKAIPGLILTLLVWSYLVYIGFIDWWIIAISIFAGLLFIARER